MVHGEFVAIKSTFGYAFWQGNCSLSEGTDKVVRPSVERFWNGDQGLGPRGFESNPVEGAARGGLSGRYRPDESRLSPARGSVSEPERSRILFKRALADLGAEPARYVRLCLRRLRYFIFFDETNPKSRVLAYRVPHLGLTIFAGHRAVSDAVRRSQETVPTDRDGRPDHAFSRVDDRVGAVSHPDRAVAGDLGRCRLSRAGDPRRWPTQPRLDTTSKASGSKTGLQVAHRVELARALARPAWCIEASFRLVSMARR